MTGREKLLVMTDEELADAIRISCTICAYRNDGDLCNSNPCQQGVVEWLKIEAQP